MSAAETRRPDLWPDAMARLLEQAGLPRPMGAEPGTALMPPEACRIRGALPVSIASHGAVMPQSSGAWLPEIGSGDPA